MPDQHHNVGFLTAMTVQLAGTYYTCQYLNWTHVYHVDGRCRKTCVHIMSPSTGHIFEGWCHKKRGKHGQSTSIKEQNSVYTALSLVSITPTTNRSSAMRRHSLWTWGFKDTTGMSCVLSSEASSFDSSSESHRATRPSWTESEKECNQQWHVCDSTDSNSNLCQTFHSEQRLIRCTCGGLF